MKIRGCLGMEKIKEFLSPAGKNKLIAYTKKEGTFPLYVVGVHIGETELFCSNAKQASGHKSAGSVSICTQCKKVEWRGITDFVAPPQYFDFFCAPGITYKEALSSFIKESVIEIIKKPTNGVIVVAFSFPIHTLWEEADQELQILLDQLFRAKEWLVPAVISIPKHYADKKTDAIMYAGKTWTTFILGKEKYSVAFGTDTDSRCFRCNDYLNNSTHEWIQKSYPSWEAGFLDICRSLSKCNNGVKGICSGFADEKYYEVIGKAMVKSSLTADIITWKNPADETAKIVLSSTNMGSSKDGGDPNRKPNKTNNEQERTVKSTEDLFKW